MRMTRERKNMKKKKPVGLIVERTFRDSSQPLALLKTFPFTRRPINLNRPNFPSPSPTLRTFDKTYGSSVLSMGLSFDERPDETLTGEKYVWHLVENHFSTLDNGNADPQSKEKPTDIERRFQKKKRTKIQSRRPKNIEKSIGRTFTYDTIRFLHFFDWQSRIDKVSELNDSVPNLFTFLDINVDRVTVVVVVSFRRLSTKSFVFDRLEKHPGLFDPCFSLESSPFSPSLSIILFPKNRNFPNCVK